MYENRQRGFNTNSRMRLPFSNTHGNPQNVFRRPSLPFPRRHMMAGRYPNIPFRHQAPAVYRSNYPAPSGNPPGFRNPIPNSPAVVSSSFSHRPPFPKPQSNFFNKNNQFSSATVNNNENHVTTEVNEQNYESRETRNVFSDLWVEASAPGGKIYYYNTRTRESTWEKPHNVRIIELQEIRQLPIRPNDENSENARNKNSNVCVQQQPTHNSQVNVFYPRAFSVSQPRLLYPPFTPPPNFLMPAAENIQKNVANVRFLMPPPMVPIPVVPRNLLPSNVINDNNASVAQNVLPISSIPGFPSNITQNLFSSAINIVENDSNISLNYFPYNNIIEYNSNVLQNVFHDSSGNECNSDMMQSLSTSNDFDNYDFNISQGLMPMNNTNEYESNVMQDLLPNPNIYEIDSNNMQDLLQNHNINMYVSNCAQDTADKYDSNVTQNLSPSTNVPECNSSVAQNLSVNEVDIIKQQNFLSKNEIVDFHKDTMQNCLSSSSMEDRREKVKRNLFSKNKIIDFSSNDSNATEAEGSTITDKKEVKFIKRENEKADINSQDISHLSAKITKSNHENTTNHKNEKSADLKSENIVHTEKIEDTVMRETKLKSSINLLSKHKPVDKSRPVSSTPVPGSYWCVVWTGDERVFFYDSKHKISVWKRPDELTNRTDVDKMVKKSPLSLNLKPLVKEARKSLSDHSDATKKQKTEDKNSDVKENSVVKDMPEKADIEKTVDDNSSEGEQKSRNVPFSREWKIEMFCEMLSDNDVSVFSTWGKENHKIAFDSRYLLLHAEERKQFFNDYIKKKSEEEINKRQKEKLQDESFLSLLMEADITSKSQFSDLVARYSEDERFTAIKEHERKENVFIQYISELKQKEKEKDKLESELKTAFSKLLDENCCFDKEWSDIQNIIAADERFKAFHSDSLKENLFKECMEEKRIAVSTNEKQERSETHVDNCEKEVKQDLSVHRNNQLKKQEKHKYPSSVSHFKALLEDLIKDSNACWESAKIVLQADSRWQYSKYLGPELCEKLFKEYITAKKRDLFHLLLDEFPEITIKTSWLDIRKDILKDPRCVAFSSCERICEKEFKQYLHSKRLSAENEFKQLLKETKLITPTSKKLLKCANNFQDKEKTLFEDGRFSNLEWIPKERRKILLSYIDDLQVKGSSSLSKPREQVKRIKRKKLFLDNRTNKLIAEV